MVIVDNVDSLRSWLVAKLTPICDADPQALAKYVIALVKKDKQESVLKAQCKEQLDVFLQKESEVFVDELFETLQSKSYMNTSQSIDSKAEVKSTQDQKRKFKDSRRLQPASGRSPGRRPRSPDFRRHDDRRHRRSPLGQRRHYNRRARSRTPSPRRRGRFSSSPPPRKRFQKSPRRSRSPSRRKPSDSPVNSPGSKRSSSSESNDKRVSDKSETKKKERCWDYNEKGFCIKGDSCPYDHGTDAVVVDDFSSVPQTNAEDKTTVPISKPQPVPLQPPPMLPSHPVMRGLPMGILFPPPPMPPMPVPPPGLLHRLQMPLMHPMSLPPPSNLPPPAYNPEDPALNKIDSNKNDVHRKRPATDDVSTEPKTKRSYYNNTTGSYNKTVIVKKIPAMLNNITKLNEHFAKFGAINNIQVKFNSKPDEALVEFAHVSSARSAMRDSEAILNNRFIRVFWHKNERSEEADQNENAKKTEIPSQYKQSDPVKPAAEKETENDKEKVSQPLAEEASHDGCDHENDDVDKLDRNVILAAEKKAIIEASITAQKKILAARQVVRQKTIERHKQVLQKKLEWQKQRQGLMQKQIEQQKLLLAKLNASRNMPASDKAELLNTLKALTNTINSTKSLNVSAASHKKVAEKQKPKTEPEVEGDEPTSISELKQKLSQLKSEAGSLGIVASHPRGSWGRGRGRGGRGRGRGNSHRFIRPGSNLDRRPSELMITGFVEEEKNEIMSHFSNFGEFESSSFGDDEVSCTIKYKSRQNAEQALSHGAHFNGRNLIVLWSSQSKSFTPTPILPEQLPQKPIDYLALSTDNVLQDDENTNGAHATASELKTTEIKARLDDEYGYGMLDEELDEEALLTGGDLDDDNDDDDDEIEISERSWRR